MPELSVGLISIPPLGQIGTLATPLLSFDAGVGVSVDATDVICSGVKLAELEALSGVGLTTAFAVQERRNKLLINAPMILVFMMMLQ